MPFSRGSSPPRDWTHFSYITFISRQVLYHKHHTAVWMIYLKSVLLGLDGPMSRLEPLDRSRTITEEYSCRPVVCRSKQGYRLKSLFPEMTCCCLLSAPDSPIQEKSWCLLFKVKHWLSLQPGCSLLTEPCRQLHICTFIPASFNCVSLKMTFLLNTFSEQSLALYISSWSVLKISVISHRLIFLTLLKFYWTNPTSRFMWFSKYQGQF